MSSFDSDAFSDGDWEERWDIAWNEFDWERYLRDQDTQLTRYLELYQKHFDRPDRIDEVAHHMGWDQETWTNDDPFLIDEVEGREATDSDNAGETAEESQDFDPYTLHRHPIYISTRSLFFWLEEQWGRLCQLTATRIPAGVALAFQKHLFWAEQYSTQAIHALDLGDYALTVSLLKRSMFMLNHAMGLLRSFPGRDCTPAAAYLSQALPRLFDIREIWLRVIRDCREEVERRFGEDESAEN